MTRGVSGGDGQSTQRLLNTFKWWRQALFDTRYTKTRRYQQASSFCGEEFEKHEVVLGKRTATAPQALFSLVLLSQDETSEMFQSATHEDMSKHFGFTVPQRLVDPPALFADGMRLTRRATLVPAHSSPLARELRDNDKAILAVGLKRRRLFLGCIFQSFLSYPASPRATAGIGQSFRWASDCCLRGISRSAARKDQYLRP
ncbi:hypothetical protein IWX50DRAFT_101698 [Phyllosticta citricarpa]